MSKIFEGTILYSRMKMCPMKYWDYKETNENLNSVIEEIDAELRLTSIEKDVDSLLEHRFSLQEKLIN